MLADKIINKYALIGAVYGFTRSCYWLNKNDELTTTKRTVVTMFSISSSIAIWPYFMLDDCETLINKKEYYPFPFNVK